VILAAGLTPAWQQMLVFDGVRTGEVNRAREVIWCGSGKVLNVGLALHHLGRGPGGCHRTLALLGGLAGKEIDAEFQALGVERRWVWSKNRTRVCTTVLDRAVGQTTELVENAAPVSPAELDEFLEAYVEEARGARMVVLSGSLPEGAPRTLYRDLLAQTSCRAVLDARGPELCEALAMEPFLVKPNREELGMTLGRKLSTEAEVIEAMAELNRRGARWVVVTHGKDAVLARGEGKTWSFRPLGVPTVNPIGCGDCLAAGVAWALDWGMDMRQAIACGIAAAAENAAMMLPSRLNAATVRERAREVSSWDR
jgi:tagatose 6-phosphate kinase